ncbi:ankyrin repeat-containing domain protein, partial [Gloeopeniophorella convolvens]
LDLYREPYQRPPGSPLYFGALCGLPFIVDHILASDSYDINANGGHHGTPPLAAAEACSLTAIGILLDHGADINARGGKYQSSVLQLAVSTDNLDMVQLLLDRGANVNALGGEYGSALHEAASIGNLDMVQLLLDHGADINVQGGLYGNMLQAAACNKKGETDIVQFFLDRGFNVDAQGGEFGTALIGASTKETSERYGTALEAVQASDSMDMSPWARGAIVKLLSSVLQDATRIVLPDGGAGSSSQ